MKLSLRVRHVAETARTLVARNLTALLAWRWGRPLGRAFLVLGALVVLAAIGRSTLAGAAGQTLAVADAGVARDPPVMTAPAPAAASIDTATALVPRNDVPPAPTADARRGPPSPDDPVVLNQATQDDLQRLPGIGAKRAQSILALRTKMGRFKQVEDLMKVRGIGRATMKRLRPLVRLDPPAPPDAGTAGGG